MFKTKAQKAKELRAALNSLEKENIGDKKDDNKNSYSTGSHYEVVSEMLASDDLSVRRLGEMLSYIGKQHSYGGKWQKWAAKEHAKVRGAKEIEARAENMRYTTKLYTLYGQYNKARKHSIKMSKKAKKRLKKFKKLDRFYSYELMGLNDKYSSIRYSINDLDAETLIELGVPAEFFHNQEKTIKRMR